MDPLDDLKLTKDYSVWGGEELGNGTITQVVAICHICDSVFRMTSDEIFEVVPFKTKSDAIVFMEKHTNEEHNANRT